MKIEKFCEIIEEIDDRYIEEAIHYEKKTKKIIWRKLGVVAACFLIMIAIKSTGDLLYEDTSIIAYAYGIEEKIPESGAIMQTGTISNNGEMRGHPLMFYCLGKEIETIRFSCKNQKISFMDWTQKREDYGSRKNFTVVYGENEEEYDRLVIDWEPDMTIRELTDNPNSTIANLPKEMREDIIVMEITFRSGKTVTKAITISLLDDGRFFASFHSYKISEKDNFIKSTSNETNLQGNQSGIDAELEKEIKENVPSINKKISNKEYKIAKSIAKDYYKDTVFEVHSIKRKNQTKDKISFRVLVSKDGIMQEVSRTIWLELINEKWEVVNEGYGYTDSHNSLE